MSEEDSEDRVVITINDQKYDVTDYIAAHPGEGHNDIYLEDYDGKDVSYEFKYYHDKRDKPVPQEILAKVDEKGKYKKIFKVYGE